jgi:Xaa-Pro aminopeptidase
LKDLGITQGRVALYGQTDISSALPLFTEIQRRLPGITLVGDPQNRILGAAMLTKDAEEVDRIRRMGKTTTEVVGMVADYLTTRTIRGDVLVGPDDEPLTIGHVKGLINLWLAERGAENPEGTIFSIGRDAGVPHSTGIAGDVLRLGQSIVFDIFPCEAGGGYFYDFTRTWCLGHAPVEVQAAYEHVRYVFETIQGELKPNVPMSEYNRRACELFEGFGYPTPRTHPDTEAGFVHGLGHGLGLRVHEHPAHHATGLPEDNLTPGVVVTVEPGLYYPEKGFGVRLEDSLYACPDGSFEVLAEYPLDLVLPMKKQGTKAR